MKFFAKKLVASCPVLLGISIINHGYKILSYGYYKTLFETEVFTFGKFVWSGEDVLNLKPSRNLITVTSI